MIYSFVFCGFICMLGQIILDNTKLTYGHITSLFVVIGAILGTFNIYDRFISVCGIGANIPIMSFGNSLVNGAYTGYLENGIIGLFSGMLSSVSAGITGTIIISFTLMLFTKPKH